MRFGSSALRFLVFSSVATGVWASARNAEQRDAAEKTESAGTLRGSAARNLKPDGTVDVVVTLKAGCSHGGLGPAGNDRAAAAANGARAADVARRNGVAAPARLYGAALVGFAGSLPAGRMEGLAADECVENVEFDGEVTLDPIEMEPEEHEETRRNLQGTQPAEETPWGITRVGGAATYTGNNKAWIIDTGIQEDHPDLIVDKASGVNFVRGKFDDGHGHGTHVAGTVAAIDNDIGVIGVAAGATVVPVRVLDNRGSGSWSGILAGVDYVAANAVSGDVANMSLGGGGTIQTLEDAVVNAAAGGVRFVLAAGNSSGHANNFTPARAEGTNVYTISACDSSDNYASFSNYGNPPVDYCAPGVGVKSTYKRSGYATWNGTSMAAPHVAGILLRGDVAEDGPVNNDPNGIYGPLARLA